MEAASAGCHLLLPDRLIYPELYADHATLYAGSAESLAQELKELAALKSKGVLPAPSSDWTARFGWTERRRALDAALSLVVQNSRKQATS